MENFGAEHWITIFGMVGLCVYLCGFRLRKDRRKKFLRTVSTELTKEEERKIRMAQNVREYCSCTSVHGVKYLVGRPSSERIMWIVVFVISFLGNSYLVSQLWNKWNETPVLVSFDERSTPISEIPFPAVTVCPMTKYRAQQYDLKSVFRGKGNNTLVEVPQWAKDISILCNEKVLFQTNETANMDVINTFKRVGVDFNETFLFYSWKGGTMSKITKSLFRETLTSDGICYTFNALDNNEIYRTSRKVGVSWTPEEGYTKERDTLAEPYPRIVDDAGITNGLSFFLKERTHDFDYWCSGITPGFKIILHSPASVPSIDKKTHYS